jgi:hypothetical protein
VELRSQSSGAAVSQIDLPTRGLSSMFEEKENWIECEHNLPGCQANFENCMFHVNNKLIREREK